MLYILRAVTLSCFAFLLFSCGQEVETMTEEVEEVKEEVAGTFGADFQASKVIPAAELLSSYSAEAIADTVMTTVRGTVDEVCQAKGCWMTIAAGGEEEMMVKFKDYGFFMPKDISGREVIMNGMAFYEVTPVDELRHYAEDAGKPQEEIDKITEPKRELKFLADGVQLLEDEL
ncbi:DUF4920 domain-containing protein [Neolewinella agarilytica]|uniref:DUF4920 domain-containing protein n=1 Tax=Neolewinella agarilytica TaxID=478744 RepID=UPI0023548FBC|nr:DUF4920 domain-containing protein [Neolewinella agarilytica]